MTVVISGLAAILIVQYFAERGQTVRD